MGFGTMISMMVYSNRKNDSAIRILCERIAKLEGKIEAYLK